MLEPVNSNKCLSWEEMSFTFNISLVGLCDNYPKGRNLRNKDGVFLKLTSIANKELDKMGVVRLGLLT
jgi:hypothetical protein